MIHEPVFDTMLFGFVASDSRITVYLKASTVYSQYRVKVLHRDGIKTVVLTTFSLSEALRELAETVAQFSNGFTSWKKL